MVGKGYGFDRTDSRWVAAGLAVLWLSTTAAQFAGREEGLTVWYGVGAAVLQLVVVAGSFLGPLIIAEHLSRDGRGERLLRRIGVGGLDEEAEVAWLLTERPRGHGGKMDPYVHQRSIERLEAFDAAAGVVDPSDLGWATRIRWARRCRRIERWREVLENYENEGGLERDLRRCLHAKDPGEGAVLVCAVVTGWYGSDTASSIWLDRHKIAGVVQDRRVLVVGEEDVVRTVHAAHATRRVQGDDGLELVEIGEDAPLDLMGALWDPNPSAVLHHPRRVVAAARALERARGERRSERVEA